MSRNTNNALPASYWEAKGLKVCFHGTWSFVNLFGTAICGPACTVVLEHGSLHRESGSGKYKVEPCLGAENQLLRLIFRLICRQNLLGYDSVITNMLQSS